MHLGELFEYVHEEAAGVSHLVVEMIRAKSVNPPGNEVVVAKILAAKMHDYGLEVSVIPLEDNRANVVAILRGKGTGPALLYSGHLDTVPPGEVEWEHDPFSGAILGDRIYGRGASDMKGGLAAMVIAAGALARAGVRLEGDLIIVGTAGEEVDSRGAKHFVDSGGLKGVGAIVISEPSYNDLYIAEKGALWLAVSTFGRMAHGSTPDLGINAILHMNAFLTELAKFRFEYHEHDLLGGPTTNVGTIKGGVKTNVVPDKCTLSIDMRTVPGMQHGPIVAGINRVCERLGSSIKDFKAKVEVVNDRPPVETDPNEEIVKLALRVGRNVLGQKLTPAGATYYTDAAVFVPAASLPMIIFGPGDAKLAHQPNEYVEIPKLRTAAKFFAALASAYLRI